MTVKAQAARPIAGVQCPSCVCNLEKKILKQKIVGYLENHHSNKLSDGLKGEKKLFLVLERGELFSFVLDFGKLLVLTFNTLESGSEC